MQPTRRKKTHAPTVGAVFESLTTDLTQLEQSLDDSTSFLLHKPRKTLITELGNESNSPRLLRKAFRSKSLDKKTKKKGSLTARVSGSPEGQFHAKAVGMLNRLPTLPPSRLGPGSYNTNPMRASHIVHFELAPRFPMTYQERLATYRPSVRALTPDERKEITHRIQENIDALKRYTPIERMKTLRERAALKENRLQLSRTQKFEIVMAVRKRREEEMEVKQRRFEWRMRGEEISVGKKRWTGIVTAIGVVADWAVKFERRKALHIRSQGILKLLLILAICVGKISITVKTKRRKRSQAVLSKLVPFAKRWIRRHRHKLADLISTHIENSISQDTICRMIATWKRRVVSIQRGIRAWLMQMNLYKQLMVKQWDKFEGSQSAAKHTKAAGGYAIKEPKSDAIVPQGVKIVIVAELLKIKIRAHITKRTEWKLRCEALIRQRLTQLEEDPLLELPDAVLPPAPRFSSVMNQKDIAELVTSAEKKKSRWDRIVKDGAALRTMKTKAGGMLAIPGG